MAKHKFRKAVKHPNAKPVAVAAAGNPGNAPSGDGAPMIDPAAGGTQPQPPMNTPMSPARRMSQRYGAPMPGDDAAS
jgi:hypothetical protein